MNPTKWRATNGEENRTFRGIVDLQSAEEMGKKENSLKIRKEKEMELTSDQTDFCWIWWAITAN